MSSPAPSAAPSVRVATPAEAAAVGAAITADVVRVALHAYPSPVTAARAVAGVTRHVSAWSGQVGPQKWAQVDGRWRVSPTMPAWPSEAFEAWALRRLSLVEPLPGPTHLLSTAMVAVTRRCPMACAHCSAGGELGAQEALGLDDLRRIVAALQHARVSFVDLTGGEPLQRLDDVVALVAGASRSSAFWVNTSGWGLDDAAAARLADAGVDGVWLSVDSDRPEEHDTLRGRHGAFEAAAVAARAVRAHGMALGLSAITTRALVDRGLTPYAELAAAWGAWAIRLVEPKAVGRWAGADVTLDPARQAAVAAFADEANGGPRRRELPAVMAPDVVQRRIGCQAGGRQSVYVDTAGVVRACPFCARRGGSLVEGTLDDALTALRATGCSRFAERALG